MIIDGLWDVYNNYHMGMTAENIAEKFKSNKESVRQLIISSKTKLNTEKKLI